MKKSTKSKLFSFTLILGFLGTFICSNAFAIADIPATTSTIDVDIVKAPPFNDEGPGRPGGKK